jgi:hypothetical protein
MGIRLSESSSQLFLGRYVAKSGANNPLNPEKSSRIKPDLESPRSRSAVIAKNLL